MDAGEHRSAERMVSKADKTRAPAVLLIATFDTKAEEALYLKEKIESLGCGVLMMDTGILAETGKPTDVTRDEVAKAGGASIDELIASRD